MKLGTVQQSQKMQLPCTTNSMAKMLHVIIQLHSMNLEPKLLVMPLTLPMEPDGPLTLSHFHAKLISNLQFMILTPNLLEFLVKIKKIGSTNLWMV